MKESFDRPKGWVIPFVEIRRENANLFIHYDIVKDETREEEEENDAYIASYVRVPYPVDEEKVKEYVIANEAEESHAEDVAKAVMEEYQPKTMNNDEED